MVAPAFREASNVIPLLPGVDPSDSDDVTVALQTARALQKKGDLHESLRWLRRAADAAERDGNDRRAVALARAAADLTSLIGTSEKTGTPTPPPSSPLAVTAKRSGPPPLPSNAQRSAPPPLPSNAQRAARTSAVPASSSLPPPLHAAVSSPPSSVEPAPIAARSSSLPSSKPAIPIDVAKLISAGSVLRVSIKRSVRDPNLLVVRKLETGKTSPPGTTEGYVVLADPGADPFSGAPPRGKV
jgi:hypothetical protein